MAIYIKQVALVAFSAFMLEKASQYPTVIVAFSLVRNICKLDVVSTYRLAGGRKRTSNPFICSMLSHISQFCINMEADIFFRNIRVCFSQNCPNLRSRFTSVFLFFKQLQIGIVKLCKMLNKYYKVFQNPLSHIPLPLTFSILLHSLVAGENFWFLTAGVAFDKAAPVEFTVALPDTCVVVRVVTPAAAHHVTAVCVGWGAITYSTPCPCASCSCVLLTVVGRAL